MRTLALRTSALLLLLGGCTLIDQTTFDPKAAQAPVIPPAPPAPPGPPPGPPALVVIAPGATDYRASLDRAVMAARARKPDVVFNVVEVQAADAVVPVGTDAVAVARAIVADGVLPDRVRLVARPEAGGRAREIRVYVQ